MCGFAGFWGKGSREVLLQMTETLVHRGPDARGIQFWEEHQLGMGFRRLAILDLRPVGNQPMKHPEQPVWIVFNGEIYNYVELRKHYLADEPLHTRTDTEVLLRLFARMDVDMFPLLNGMFAMVIVDLRSGKPRLILARDRMGKKPLYYGRFDGTWLFGSEIKSLLRHPSFRKILDLRALITYLAWDYVPTPLSIYAGLRKLDPGTWLEISDRTALPAPRAFYSFRFRSDLSVESADKIQSFSEAQNRLDHLLQESVKIRLRSDVPVGVFLSGGIDSSTLAWYVGRETSRVQAFCIGFPDPSYDESDYARDVASCVGIPCIVEVMDAPTAEQVMEEIYPRMDEPFADASLIPTYYLCKLARKHIVVALGGDGGDELLGGYPTYQVAWWVHILRLYWIPSQIWRLLDHLLFRVLPASDRNMSWSFRVHQFVQGMQVRHPYHDPFWIGAWLPREILSSERDRKLGSFPLGFLHQRVPFVRPFSEWIHELYYRTYLCDDILVKVDRASMLNSLEVRAPFLDVRVVDFLNGLPRRWKWTGYRGKRILRELMKDRLPEHVFQRPKKGFGIPVGKWLRGPLYERFHVRVHSLFRALPFLNRAFIQETIRLHMERRADYRKRLWNLLVLGEWLEHYGFTDLSDDV